MPRSSFSRVSVSDVAGWNNTHSPGRREIATPRGTPGRIDAFLLFRPPLTEIRAHRLRNHNPCRRAHPRACPAKAGTGFASGQATKPRLAARGRFEDKLLLLYNAAFGAAEPKEARRVARVAGFFRSTCRLLIWQLIDGFKNILLDARGFGLLYRCDHCHTDT